MSIESDIEAIAAERKDAVKHLRLFDTNIWLGKPKGFPLAEELKVEQLETVMARYDLEGGLVSSWDAVTMSAQDGNIALEQIEEGLPDQVYVIWNGLPLLPREQEPLPGFQKPRQRTGGVRLFPKTHRYILKPWVVGTLCEWCVQFHLPLFLWHVEVEWDWVYELACSFPRLSIVVESQWQKILYHIRTLYNLLDTCGNIYVETSNFTGQDYLSHGVKTFGAERFLFGSFLPMNDPWVPAGMIQDADISEEEKKMIAGGNIRRLLEEVRL